MLTNKSIRCVYHTGITSMTKSFRSQTFRWWWELTTYSKRKRLKDAIR